MCTNINVHKYKMCINMKHKCAHILYKRKRSGVAKMKIACRPHKRIQFHRKFIFVQRLILFYIKCTIIVIMIIEPSPST